MPLPCGNNFPTPLADMQDLYGLAPNTSTSNAPKASTSNPSSRSSSSSPAFSFARILRRKERTSSSESSSTSPSSTSPSNSRRSSMDSQTTLTSTAVPTASKATPAPRDYEAALGTLSSSYGFTGAPLRPTAISKTTSKQGQKPEHSHS